MLAKQNHACAVCKLTDPKGVGSWHVDHDHNTGAVRGLLCHHCNLLLGHAADDPERLRQAIHYLVAWRALALLEKELEAAAFNTLDDPRIPPKLRTPC